MADQWSGVRGIVVSLDGSDDAEHVLKWAVGLAGKVDAEIVAVLAVELPAYTYYPNQSVSPFPYVEEWQQGPKHVFESASLKQPGLRFQTVLEEGRPAQVILDVAKRVGADLRGRQAGRGGFADLLLGSVSHELSHYSDRLVVLVSRETSAAEANTLSPEGAQA